MQKIQLVIFFLIKFCNSTIFEISLNCDCEFKSSTCYSSKIIKREIDESTRFVNKYCNLLEIEDVQLSWLTEGVQRQLEEFSKIKNLKITNSNLENSSKYLQNLPNLQTLKIPGNNIKNLPNFNNQKIEKIFINKNKIEIVRNKIFENLKN